MRRYKVCEMIDVFEEPYAIWDNTENIYYAFDEIIQTFISKKAAERYQRQPSKKENGRAKIN